MKECRTQGKSAIIVLGHPDYYARFGFSDTLAATIRSPFSNEGEAWMAIELATDALRNVSGEVHYPKAFGIVS
jgi:putative acetyltransferase